MRFASALVLVLSAAPLAGQAPTDPIPTSCIPFGSIASNRAIDQTCGLQGALSGTPGEMAQDRVKNNLCAWQDASPVTITRFTFDQLQQNTPSKASLPWGWPDRIPNSDADRMVLHDLYTTTNGDTI